MDYTKIDFYSEKLKKMLTQSRFEHTIRTVNKAVELAKGTDADIQVVLIASLLHDCAKYIEPTAQQADELKDFMQYPQIVHAPLGAIIAQEEFGITDERILNAIKYHTTGRENMSIEEKIVFLADAIEDGRNFGGINEIRELAQKSIDLAMIEVIKGTIEFERTKQNEELHPLTYQTLSYLEKENL